MDVLRLFSESEKSQPQTLLYLMFICCLFLNSGSLCHRCVWTVTDGKESSSVTRLCSDSLGTPKYAAFISLDSLRVGWEEAPQNIYGLLEYKHFMCEWFSVAFFVNSTNVDQTLGKYTPKNGPNPVWNFIVL